MTWRTGLGLAACLLGLTQTAGAQAGAGGGGSAPCRFRLLNVDREGLRVTVRPGVENFYAGGNVQIACVGQPVRMRADSVAIFEGRIAIFLGHVFYEDSTAAMTADAGTYYRDDDRWEARDDVVFTNLVDSTTLTGPTLIWWRPLENTRPQSAMFAEHRPTVRLTPPDTAESREPYILIGDRIRGRGNNEYWAGGSVTIDRSDLSGRADSLELDTGAGHRGLLLGHAVVRSQTTDTFTLSSVRNDLTLDGRELRRSLATDGARLIGKDLDLAADSIAIAFEHRMVQQTTAWGDAAAAPVLLSGTHQIRGDSLVVETPDQRLQEIHAFGRGWAGLSGTTAPDTVAAAPPDSLPVADAVRTAALPTATPRPATLSKDSLPAVPPDLGTGDWMAGDTLHLFFDTPPGDTAGRSPVLEELRAHHAAQAYYRMADEGTGSEPSINYTRADAIAVYFRQERDSTAVERVVATGTVDGVQLQPVGAVGAAAAALPGRGRRQ